MNSESTKAARRPAFEGWFTSRLPIGIVIPGRRWKANGMRGTAMMLGVAILFSSSGPVLAQAPATQRSNPFGRQGDTAASPLSPSSRPATPDARGGSTAAQAGVNQFSTEESAKQACGMDTVVWVNTGGSKAWHISGDRYYGHTKRGAYMCQQVAQQGGYHAAGGSNRAQRSPAQGH